MASKKEVSSDKKNQIHTIDSTNTGEVKIADDVVASIAAIAAGEVDGVSAMAGNISDKLMNSVGMHVGTGAGVRVDVAGNMVRVDIALVIKYGHNIMETSKRVAGVNSETRNDK